MRIELFCNDSVQLTLVYGPATQGMRHGNRLGSSEVVPGTIQVKHLFRNGEGAGSGRAQLQQRQRIDLQ